MPLLARDTLGLRQHLFAEPMALLAGVDRKHAEIAGRTLPLDVATRHQRATACRQQHPAVRSRDQGADVCRVGALAIQQMGFGGPAAQAGFAAIGRFDQGHDRRNVFGGGDAKDDVGKHFGHRRMVMRGLPVNHDLRQATQTAAGSTATNRPAGGLRAP
ncbi:hypothetical protein RLIN73S_06883 [Rhodanobacter lindaniclasticus]